MRFHIALAACLLTSPAWAADPIARQGYPTAIDHGSVPVTIPGGIDINGFAVPCGSSTVVTGCGLTNGVTPPASVADPNNAAFQGVVAITPGTATTAQRSIGFVCTAAGNITITMADNSSLTVGIIASPTLQTLPLAVTNIALGTGTAGTFWGLK